MSYPADGTPSTPKPSVGRIVHYVSHGTPPRPDGTQAYTAQCRAAIVTQVNEDGTVGLCVLNPTGMFFYESVGQASGDSLELLGGTWHWPERS
ncbi:hypothetical protein [Actinokineospora globicatena]|uniref:Uncharacterized protein n=1 Tax=Actinokineospora globicatena TaxID=103729 RepID=A0A9W6VAA9_9PSEU|nr:hypothetical protein [Actinokineospora globicatena]GLW91788.1 hypothetical protein Aglo03_26040 [Actinokineospora globicatena]